MESTQENNPQSNNKRIAKNTIMLYVRMLLSIVVSLYTSRVVLQTLGIEDYGIYGVVGGVVAMFSFLNAAMSGATSRFLTFEMGKQNNAVCLRDTFSSAMIIHIGISVIVFLLIESIGVWFLCNKLIIPENRMMAAHIVLQCSVISMFITVTQVPYNSAIIAHEKMDVYAYVELLNVFLKLGIVYLLLIGNFDKLILYSFLMLGVNVIVAITYRVYCLKHFEETVFHWVWEKRILKPMLLFSGWDLFGNMTFVVKQQGTNFILNMFFGLALNAANGVATTVQGIIQGFSSNVLQAFRPVIIKDYAAKDILSMQIHLTSAIKYSLLLLALISTPLFLEADYIMHIWLGVVPEYAVEFCQLLLINNFFATISTTIIIPIHSTGNIKRMSYILGTINLATVLLIYIGCYIFHDMPSIAYIVTLLTSMATLICSCAISKSLIPHISYRLIAKELSKTVGTIIVAAVIASTIFINTSQSFGRVLLIVAANCVVLFITTYLLLDKKTRKAINVRYLNDKERCVNNRI